MKMSILTGCLILSLVSRVFAVWPPSTVLQEEMNCSAGGFVVLAFIIGIVIGIWIQRSRHERE